MKIRSSDGVDTRPEIALEELSEGPITDREFDERIALWRTIRLIRDLGKTSQHGSVLANKHASAFFSACRGSRVLLEPDLKEIIVRDRPTIQRSHSTVISFDGDPGWSIDTTAGHVWMNDKMSTVR